MKKTITPLLIGALLSATPLFSQWINTNCTGTGSTYDMVEAGGKLLVARGGLYSSADGLTWTTASTGASFGSCRTLKSFGGTLYAGYNGSSFYTSTNNGNTWTALSGKSGLTSVYSTSLYKNNAVLIYGVDNGSGSTYYSTNNGSSWITSQYNYGSGSQQGFEVTGYDIVELNGVLFHSSYKKLFKSANQGATWTVVATSPTISPGTVTSLCAMNGGLLLSVYGSGVFKSTDNGNSWTKVLGGAFGAVANNITRVYYENGVALAGGAAGQVHLSTDNGSTWTDISETGINTGDVVQSFKLFGNHIYVGTNTNVYRKAFAGVGLNDRRNTAIHFALCPNPAKTELTISGLKQDADYKISIASVDGKLIRMTGSAEYIDVSGFNPGLYFITVADALGNSGTLKFVKE